MNQTTYKWLLEANCIIVRVGIVTNMDGFGRVYSNITKMFLIKVDIGRICMRHRWHRIRWNFKTCVITIGGFYINSSAWSTESSNDRRRLLSTEWDVRGSRMQSICKQCNYDYVPLACSLRVLVSIGEANREDREKKRNEKPRAQKQRRKKSKHLNIY